MSICSRISTFAYVGTQSKRQLIEDEEIEASEESVGEESGSSEGDDELEDDLGNGESNDEDEDDSEDDREGVVEGEASSEDDEAEEEWGGLGEATTTSEDSSATKPTDTVPGKTHNSGEYPCTTDYIFQERDMFPRIFARRPMTCSLKHKSS